MKRIELSPAIFVKMETEEPHMTSDILLAIDRACSRNTSKAKPSQRTRRDITFEPLMHSVLVGDAAEVQRVMTICGFKAETRNFRYDVWLMQQQADGGYDMLRLPRRDEPVPLTNSYFISGPVNPDAAADDCDILLGIAMLIDAIYEELVPSAKHS